MKNVYNQADATYKVNFDGYPVFLSGNSDFDRHFNPLCAAICSNEKCDDFAFVFRELKKFVKEIYREEYRPEVLVSDAADAIYNGCVAVFGGICRVVCWAHVFRALEKKLDAFLPGHPEM